MSEVIEVLAVNAENPWPGLLSFREGDQAYFHGRKGETEELLRLVLRTRLSVLFGLSGLGKSSLLQAGLFPRLRNEGVFPVYVRLDFSPEASGLVAQVKDAVFREAAAAHIEAPRGESRDTLWEMLHRHDADFWDKRNLPVTPLLVFDQFEEIFTLGRANPARKQAAEALLDELADLAEGRPPAAVKARLDGHPEEASQFEFGRHPYKLLLAVREDFLPEMEELRRRTSSVTLNRMRLRRMNGEAAVEVVNHAPQLMDSVVADRVVRFVAAGTIERPLAELEVEPALLSVVCRELNNKRRQRNEPKITADLLEGSKEEVLRDFYERSMADLPPDVRSFIEERLLTVSGYRDSVALENALSMPGVTRQAIDLLVARRLVRIEERGGVQRLELTHDLLAGVIRASRDARHQAEAAEQERKALREAKERERQAKAGEEKALKHLRRSRIRSAAISVVALLAILASGLAYREQRALKRGLVRSTLAEVQRLAETGRPDQALAYAARALRLDPSSLVAQSWASHFLLQRSWWIPTKRLQHQGPVLSAVFSLDGSRIVTASQDGTAQIWDAETGKPVGELLRHEKDKAVHSAVFSPDGRRVVTASDDGTARIWDAETGKPVGESLRHERDKDVLSAVFSPDGRRVVTASEDRTARIWDAETRKPIGEPLLHEMEVMSAVFSPDGRRVVTASLDGTARIWDGKTGKPVGKPLRHEDRVWSAVFSPDGRHVVTGSADDTARIWDAETGKAIGKPLRHRGYVWSAAFSPNGLRVVTASEDGTARIWDVETAEPVGGPLQHWHTVSSAVFSPDGLQVLTVSLDEARIWDAQSGTFISDRFRHEGTVESAVFSADGNRVVTASRDGTARIWGVGIEKPVREPLQHGDIVQSAVFSPDGRRVVTASSDNTARIWDAETGKQVGEPMRHKSYVDAAVFSPDGRRVVTGSGDDTARIWDAETGKPIGRPLLHQDRVEFAVFSPDGLHLVTTSYNTVRLWDVQTEMQVGEAMLHEQEVKSVVFSRDGRRIVTASNDGTAQIWDAETQKRIGEPERAVTSAVFSPDGRRVVTASNDGTARIWDAKTGKPVGEPWRHEEGLSSAEFSPDGRRIVTVSNDRTAQIWDAETQKRMGEPMRHEREVESAAFSPDGRRVVTASDDGTARIWDAETGKPAGEPLRHEDIVTSAVFGPDGGHVLTASWDKTARIWSVLVDTNSKQETETLADAAETVAGLRVNDDGQLVPVADPEQRLDKLYKYAETGPQREGSVAWFLHQFLPPRK